MISDIKDIELIHQFFQGDITSFEQLVDRYQNYVYGTVMRLVMNKEDAEDLVQEIFIKAYSLLKDYNLKYEFKSWLYKVSINYTIDFLRKKKSDNNVSIEPEKICEINQKLIREEECEPVLAVNEIYHLLEKLNN
ncbi:MAG: sigma-70 family RNA polymerase sigma factor [Endomicrobiia bacterium]